MVAPPFIAADAAPTVRFARLLAAAALMLQGALALAQAVPDAPEIGARSYLLMDFASGQIIAENNADERLEPASLTKIMTAFAVFDELAADQLKLDEMAVVSRKARAMPGSRMFVEADSKVSIEALLKGLIVQSGNDASVALAEHIAGGEDAFAGLMNARAKEIGMANTNFENASGLPGEAHFSTARDLALLSRALIARHPELYKWHAIREYDWNGVTQRNRNRLLWRDDSVDGIKTGYTKAAGYCLVASAERDGMRLVSVVMGADNVGARVRQSEALLNYGFRFFESHTVYPANQPVTTARVWMGEDKQLPLGLGDALNVMVPRGRFADVTATIDVAERIEAPVSLGQPYGSVRVALDDDVLADRPLTALKPVARGGLLRRAADTVLELVQ